MIKCEYCQEEKDDLELTYIVKGKVRKRARCISCRKKDRRERVNKYRQSNRELVIKRGRDFRLKNKDSINEKSRQKRKDFPEKERQYQKEWAAKNKDKRTAYTMKWRHKSPENMKKHTATAIAYQRRFAEKFPEKLIIKRMRRHFRRIIKGIKAQKSFVYIGVSSVEEFLSILSSKTDNPNWVQDGYEVDHIWQINWFDEKPEMEDWAEKLSHIVHHHSNIRPLEERLNSIRSYYDFSPLKQEDFQKFEPYLNESVKLALLKYWENLHLFSGAQINKCSEEERVLLKLIA